MVAAAVAAAMLTVSATPTFAARDGQVRVEVHGLDARHLVQVVDAP